MKQRLKFIPFFLFCIIILLGCRSSCEDALNFPEKNNLKSIDKSGLSIGEIHNELLTYTLENYSYPTNFNNIDEALTNLANFQGGYMNSFIDPPFDRNHAVISLGDMKNYYIASNSKDAFLNGVIINNKNYQLTELNDIFYNAGKISEIDKNIVNSIISSLHKNLDGTLSNKALYDELLVHKSNWEKSQKNSQNVGGEYSYMILDIGIHSLEWWEQNSDTTINQKKLAPWIASDIVGAIAGAGLSVGLQYFLTPTGQINWKIVAGSAIAGAITGSTGIIGKAGKWLSTFF